MNFKVNIDPVMKLPVQKKLGILAGINIFIIAVLYWFLIAPQYANVKALDAQLAELEQKLEESRRIAADIPKFQKEKEDLENRLMEAIAKLPNEKEIPDLIDSISSAGRKSGLKIAVFKPGKEVSKGFYADVPVNMTVEGRYESLYEFSVKIANLPRIVNIGGMNILSAGHKNKIPALKADFVATTFRFIPTPEPGAEGAQESKKP